MGVSEELLRRAARLPCGNRAGHADGIDIPEARQSVRLSLLARRCHQSRHIGMRQHSAGIVEQECKTGLPELLRAQHGLSFVQKDISSHDAAEAFDNRHTKRVAASPVAKKI